MLSSMTTGTFIFCYIPAGQVSGTQNICWMNESEMSLLPNTRFLESMLNRRNGFYLPKNQKSKGQWMGKCMPL
jgi:hypothetical protein